MKLKALITLFLVALILISCSREEPTVPVIVVKPTIVKLNELYSRGVPTDPDWIEIYNASEIEVDLGGYKVYDSGGQSGAKPKLEIPAGTKVPAKGYFVIVTDIASSVNPAGFGLSSGGEEVWLVDKTGAVIDNVAFLAMSETQSYSRVPDGGTWALSNTITKGKTNK